MYSSRLLYCWLFWAHLSSFCVSGVQFSRAQLTDAAETILRLLWWSVFIVLYIFDNFATVAATTFSFPITSLLYHRPSQVRLSPEGLSKKKVKLKVRTLGIAPLRESSPQRRSGMARRVLNGSRSFTCTPTRSSIPVFAFPAIAGTHLQTPEGWKAKLAWVAGYVVRKFTF